MNKTIYLAGGCFWGLQKLMNSIVGVVRTSVGYANGTGEADATYNKVCAGNTGFRETVKVEYDTAKVSIDTLLLAFFHVIDPEAVNRQGNDHGTQYQAGIYFTAGDKDTEADVARIADIERERYAHFAVEIKPLLNFFDGEEYHQDYLEKTPGGYCHISFKEINDVQKMAIDYGKYRKPAAMQIKEALDKEQYRVTQESGTEPPFRNQYWDKFAKGIYVDIVSGEPLFTSTDKYTSDCGWPAFSKPIENFSIFEKTDKSHGMMRTEVRSRAGNSHLGHVFDGDSQSPTGVRYCINSASLRFIPFDKMDEEGYSEFKRLI